MSCSPGSSRLGTLGNRRWPPAGTHVLSGHQAHLMMWLAGSPPLRLFVFFAQPAVYLLSGLHAGHAMRCTQGRWEGVCRSPICISCGFKAEGQLGASVVRHVDSWWLRLQLLWHCDFLYFPFRLIHNAQGCVFPFWPPLSSAYQHQSICGACVAGNTSQLAIRTTSLVVTHPSALQEGVPSEGLAHNSAATPLIWLPLWLPFSLFPVPSCAVPSPCRTLSPDV